MPSAPSCACTRTIEDWRHGRRSACVWCTAGRIDRAVTYEHPEGRCFDGPHEFIAFCTGASASLATKCFSWRSYRSTRVGSCVARGTEYVLAAQIDHSEQLQTSATATSKRYACLIACISLNYVPFYRKVPVKSSFVFAMLRVNVEVSCVTCSHQQPQPRANQEHVSLVKGFTLLACSFRLFRRQIPLSEPGSTIGVRVRPLHYRWESTI